MYDELLNEQESRERVQQFIKDAQEYRQIHETQTEKKKSSLLKTLRSNIVGKFIN